MMTLLQDASLPLENFSLSRCQLICFDHFDGHLISSFLFLSLENIGVVSSSYFLLPYIKVLNCSGFKLCQMSVPFIKQIFLPEVVSLCRVKAIPMLEDKSIFFATSFSLECIYSQPLQIDYISWYFFLSVHDKNGLLNELQVNHDFFLLVVLLCFWLYPRLSSQVFRVSEVINLPDIGVEASKIGLEKTGMVLNQFKKMLLLEDIFIFVKAWWYKQKASILTS